MSTVPLSSAELQERLAHSAFIDFMGLVVV